MNTDFKTFLFFLLNVKSIIHTFAEAESGNHGVEIDIFIFQVLLDRFLAKPNTEFFSDFFLIRICFIGIQCKYMYFNKALSWLL